MAKVFSAKEGRLSLIFLGALMLLGALVRIPLLNQSLWYDEVWYSTFTGLREIGGGIRRHLLFDKAAPFYQLLMYGWIRLFGDSEISVRMIPYLSGILSILYVYLVGLKLTDKPGALFAALLLSLSAAHVWYSREAVPYSFLILLSLVCVHAFYSLKEPGRFFPWYWVYFFSLLILPFTHWYAFVLVLIFSFLAVSDSELTRNRKAAVLAGPFVTAAMIAAFLIYKAMHGKVVIEHFSFLKPFSAFDMLMLFFNYFPFGNSLWPLRSIHPAWADLTARSLLMVSQLFIAFCFIRGIVKKGGGRRWELSAYLFTLPLLLFLACLWGYRKIYIERYTLILLPFFYLALARGVLSFASKWKCLVAALLAVFLSAAALAGSFISVWEEKWSVYKPHADWKAAVRFFADQPETFEGCSYLIFASAPVMSFIYYLNRLPAMKNKKFHFRVFPPRNLQTFLSSFHACRPGTFYFLRDDYWNMTLSAWEKALAEIPQARKVREISAPGIQVYQYQFEEPASGER